MIWLPQGFSRRERENSWDAKGHVCIPPLALPVHRVEETWHKADAPQHVPSLPLEAFMSSGSLYPPCSPLFVSRTHVLYWHISNPEFSAPDTIKFCNYRGKKREKKRGGGKKIELVYHNLFLTNPFHFLHYWCTSNAFWKELFWIGPNKKFCHGKPLQRERQLKRGKNL